MTTTSTTCTSSKGTSSTHTSAAGISSGGSKSTIKGKSILEELFGRKVDDKKASNRDDDDDDEDDDDDDDNYDSEELDRLDLSMGTSETEHSSSAYSRFLTDDALNDITLAGNDGVKVPANRGILASKSRVFQRLLLGSFAITDKGDFKSVQLDFKGEVIRAVVEFVLTDTAKILDITTIRAQKRRSCARSTQSAPGGSRSSTASRGLFDHIFQKPARASSSQTIIASSIKSVTSKSSRTIIPSIYTLAQIQALVSLTRAAVFFNLPTLGNQALETLSLYLQRSPSAAFAVLESIRQEQPQEGGQGVPREVQGMAATSLRNFVGSVEPGTVEFLSLAVLQEIVQDDKLRMDDYQIFKIVRQWAFYPPPHEPQEGGVGIDAKTIVTSNVPPGKQDTTSTTSASKNYTEHATDPVRSTTNSIRDRKAVAQDLISKYIRLESIDPPILATSVANSGLVTQEQLLQAFHKQAMAAYKFYGVVYQRPRNTTASWKKSLSDVFTSRHDDEFKEDVLQYPPMKSGIHQWTLLVEESGDCTWLGLSMSNLCNTFAEDEEDAMQDRTWVYGSDGEAFHGGVAQLQPLTGSGSKTNTRPGFSSGSQITMTLNLRSKDSGKGTLNGSVNGGDTFTIFDNLRRHLHEHDGEGYLPCVSMNTPGRVRLVDIRHLPG
jgi:BTB/POZ domain